MFFVLLKNTILDMFWYELVFLAILKSSVYIFLLVSNIRLWNHERVLLKLYWPLHICVLNKTSFSPQITSKCNLETYELTPSIITLKFFVLLTSSDGAAAIVLVSGAKAKELGLKVIAKIRGYADAAQVHLKLLAHALWGHKFLIFKFFHWRVDDAANRISYDVAMNS